MAIWVDADACPVLAREILFKAAQRTKMPLYLVANQSMRTPPDAHIQSIVVAQGFDVADDQIVERCQTGDLVITSDIPLAADVLKKGAAALNPRGDEYDASTIRAQLNIRDFMDTMRASGERTGGQRPYGQKEKQSFANALDRWLARATIQS
ncbi:YaiI/YqxD family protein [Alteromonas oceanisediminis]|uniref:YaiI/YqxD family protein n=1 Tax=Alteromonas oceanisediminis TaxID=2836180 RepID=UPI001BDB5B84|nr:YaiI/YqxD family protein [Alteromonas oceanisediminis]MBT0586389.1 YaiI/YqxD family protein [Alteromonas oceanisediminis]